MHARLDHRLAAPLRGEPGLDRGEDLVVGQRERRDVGAVEVVDRRAPLGVAVIGVARSTPRVYTVTARVVRPRCGWRCGAMASTIGRDRWNSRRHASPAQARRLRPDAVEKRRRTNDGNRRLSRGRAARRFRLAREHCRRQRRRPVLALRRRRPDARPPRRAPACASTGDDAHGRAARRPTSRTRSAATMPSRARSSTGPVRDFNLMLRRGRVRGRVVVVREAAARIAPARWRVCHAAAGAVECLVPGHPPLAIAPDHTVIFDDADDSAERVRSPSIRCRRTRSRSWR